MKKLIIQLIKFGIVGVFATVIDVSVLMLLKEIMHIDVLVASAVAFSVSVVANYILSMLFVFESGEKSKVKEFALFVSLSIGGLLINQFIMWLGTEIMVVYYLWVKVFALVFVPIYNFVTRKIFLEKSYVRNTNKNNKFSKDLYRYYGDKGESLAQRILRPTEIRYIALFRKAENCKFKPLKLYYAVKLKLMSYKTHIQIPLRTKIDEGFYIGHTGRVIINPDAVLGKNINIGTGVTIGCENRGNRKGAPVFEGDCWIGTNSVVVGNVKIGKDVMIAPLTFVNFDVPSHSIVIGNPAKIIHKENATESYIENRV